MEQRLVLWKISAKSSTLDFKKREIENIQIKLCMEEDGFWCHRREAAIQMNSPHTTMAWHKKKPIHSYNLPRPNREEIENQTDQLQIKAEPVIKNPSLNKSPEPDGCIADFYQTLKVPSQTPQKKTSSGGVLTNPLQETSFTPILKDTARK